MEKVAVLTLILTLTTVAGESWAQRWQTSSHENATARVTERRFRKILGDDYNSSTADVLDEKPLRKRRKKKSTEDRVAEREYQKSRDEAYPDYAQPSRLIEMSLRFAPHATINRIEGSGEYLGFAQNGAAVRPSVGVSLDYFFFKDRYAFSSGLWYTIKRVGYRIPGSYGETRWNPGAPAKYSVYNLQYVQVPVTVKLFANNLFTSSRLYIQTGGLLDVKLAEKPLDQSRNAYYQVAQSEGTRRQFGFADVAWIVGGGLQYRLSRTNALNVGLSYQRGLLDVARPRDLTVRNRLIALELGLKF
jgi:hypothetical protein